MVGKLWASHWWLPVMFAITTTGVGVVFSARPAIILALGALFGTVAWKTGATKAHWWRTFLRVSIFIVAGTLMFLAMWAFHPSTDLGLAAAIVAGSTAVLLTSRRLLKNEPGRAALYGWAGQTNPGPWLTPLSTGISADATVGTITADVAGLPLVLVQMRWIRAGSTVALRRWSLVDYLVPAAAAAGLTLGVFYPRPFGASDAIVWLASISGLLGVTSAVGSLLAENGHQPPAREPVLFYLKMVAVRAVVTITVATICYLCGFLPAMYWPLVGAAVFSAPTINPASLAVLYGYRNAGVVHAAMRAGLGISAVGVWVLAAVM